jgi:hypothetical protein
MQWFDLHNRGPLDLRPDFPAEAWDAGPGVHTYESGCALSLGLCIKALKGTRGHIAFFLGRFRAFPVLVHHVM